MKSFLPSFGRYDSVNTTAGIIGFSRAEFLSKNDPQKRVTLTEEGEEERRERREEGERGRGREAEREREGGLKPVRHTVNLLLFTC